MNKIFITTVAQQSGKFDAMIYKTDDPSLKSDRPTHYPIIYAIENNVEPDDDIELIVLQYPTPALDKNFAILKDYITKIEEAKNIKIKLTTIEHLGNETNEGHIALFKELKSKIPVNGKLYADITYGTKPTPVILFTVLSYLSILRPYISVEKIIYGQINWGTDETGKSVANGASLFDVSKLLKRLYYAEKLMEDGGDNVEEVLDHML
ncbi:hypothetical protein FACS1894105_00470 [Clostridia bacterium]|nr:hypothetical protein FACS1894105_00470 [Clostridia bacterium]